MKKSAMLVILIGLVISVALPSCKKEGVKEEPTEEVLLRVRGEGSEGIFTSEIFYIR